MKDGARRHDKVVVAGDFNSKSTSWGGTTTDKRGRVLMEALCGYGVFPLRLKEKYTFSKNGRTSCPDIISVLNKVNEMHVESVVSDKYSVSDHLYIMHSFKLRTTRRASKFFRYVTKNLAPDEFLNGFDDTVEVIDQEKDNRTDRAELLQKTIERTCDVMLKKVSGATNRKYANYWWNAKIAELRTQTHKATLRKATRERKKDFGNTDLLVTTNKRIRKQLKMEIAHSKARAWADFCKILEGDP